MSKIDDNLRIEWTKRIVDFFSSYEEEILHEKDNIIWIPTVDAEGNDKWIKINVQVPTKVEEGCDGYALDEAYRAKKIAKAEKAKADAEKKAKKIASDKAKREAKAKARASEI